MLFLLLLRFTAPVMVWVLIIGLLGAGAYGKHSPGVVFKANCIIGLGQECSAALQPNCTTTQTSSILSKLAQNKVNSHIFPLQKKVLLGQFKVIFVRISSE